MIHQTMPTPELLEQQKKRIATIYESLPTVDEPTRENTCVLLPLGNYQLDVETHHGLMHSISRYAGELTACGHSDVGLAREKLFNQALRTPYEWFVCIDSDIGFTGDDFTSLCTLESNRDYAVNGVYAKKQEQEEAVTMGLGFARVHRCVLEAISQHYPLRYMDDGEECQHFCLQSVTGNKIMMREDVGFWFLCASCGVRPRLLTNIELRHYGGRYGHTLSEFARDHLL